MVPVWDLLNHVTNESNVRLHHDATQGCLQMIATQAIASGCQVINNFGDHSNGMLLLKCASSQLHDARCSSCHAVHVLDCSRSPECHCQHYDEACCVMLPLLRMKANFTGVRLACAHAQCIKIKPSICYHWHTALQPCRHAWRQVVLHRGVAVVTMPASVQCLQVRVC